MSKITRFFFYFFLFFILVSLSAYATPSYQSLPTDIDRPPRSPTDVTASDTPNDAGRSITIRWTLSPDDGAGDNDVLKYEILRSTAHDRGYEKIGEVLLSESTYIDTQVEDGVTYYYKVGAIDEHNATFSGPSLPVQSSGQWFNTDRINMLLCTIVLCSVIILFISSARKGKELFVRRIAGLAAVDEAIGRATEMGRPVLYLPSGAGSAVSEIQTLAGLVILGRVARKTAEYETPLLVPTCDPLVMTLAREIVRTSYIDVGRPDTYNEDNIRFLTTEQFAFTAGVDGIMLREKPAANFFLGMFYAESLILAETGYSTGAIQIAGTAMPSQLPFFIAACDYTLIGEELYAASAYLSREPVQLGSLKGQDLGKAIILGLIILGVILESLALQFPFLHQFKEWFTAL